MYDWRKMTQEERIEILRERQERKSAWHRPSVKFEGKWVHLTAACYEHRCLIGRDPLRLGSFSDELLDTISKVAMEISAWCVLPNHYHVLTRVADVGILTQNIGRLHGRTSHQWNVEEDKQGRTCFHGCLPKPVKSLSHRWATLNYIHHNPVKHGYVERWQDWPYTSAHAYLDAVGHAYARRMWDEFPILDMGKGWDEEIGP
ncbi:MAG: transposase [Verrucomicrobia bacterium]|nr:transposase [Verrucomicrobiota bacterium]MCH8513158.1 hypothetical protein [Kiritimatiellia bacterium]